LRLKRPEFAITASSKSDTAPLGSHDSELNSTAR
jgi:hypothetical protein